MLTHKLLWKNSNEVDWINNKNNNCKDEKRDSLDPQEGQAIGIVTLGRDLNSWVKSFRFVPWLHNFWCDTPAFTFNFPIW